MFAQTDWARHAIVLGAGAGVPIGRETIGSSAPLARFSYGLRVHRNFQADVGLESIIGSFEVCCYSRETHYATAAFLLVPFGGRIVIPNERVDFYAGGGLARSHYTNSLSNYLELFGGWGGYALIGGSTRFRGSNRVRGGGSARYYNFHPHLSAGSTIYSVQHRWIAVSGDIEFRLR